MLASIAVGGTAPTRLVAVQTLSLMFSLWFQCPSWQRPGTAAWLDEPIVGDASAELEVPATVSDLKLELMVVATVLCRVAQVRCGGVARLGKAKGPHANGRCSPSFHHWHPPVRWVDWPILAAKATCQPLFAHERGNAGSRWS